jgi:hypothetical protein
MEAIMNPKILIVLFYFSVWLFLPGPLSAQQLRQNVLASGGATTSDGTRILKSTVGQPAIGKVGNTAVQHGAGFWYATVGLVTSVEAVSEEPVPRTFRLDQNYPNPFNPVTTIRFAVPQRTHVSLKLYDVLGRRVLTLVDETLAPGEYKVQLEADALGSGVYFYRMRTGEFTKTRKLTVLK